MEEIIKKIYDYSLEEIMGERFGKYSKYIIQESSYTRCKRWTKTRSKTNTIFNV